MDKPKSEKLKNSASSKKLKPGDFREIIIDILKLRLPDFEYYSYKNNTYTFLRVRSYKSLDVFETFHIVFSIKNGCISCSVASRLNKEHIELSAYSSGLINPHSDLIVIKEGNGPIPFKNAYYFHDGFKTNVEIQIERMLKDMQGFGLKFLEDQFERLNQNAIINTGLDYFLSYDKKQFKNEIEAELKFKKFTISSLAHPKFIELKEMLQNVKDQTREDRKLIPNLAYELLIL